jgi:hypothetical protein
MTNKEHWFTNLEQILQGKLGISIANDKPFRLQK